MSNPESIKTKDIYVFLLNEGVEVWRPTQAIELGKGLYKILATEHYDPEDETWKFPPGSIVRGENKKLSNGIFFVAVDA